MNQQQRDEMHNTMMEDFSDVIAKHFPNFDYYTAKTSTKKTEMFKMYENYQEKAVA